MFREPHFMQAMPLGHLAAMNSRSTASLSENRAAASRIVMPLRWDFPGPVCISYPSLS